MWAIYLKPEGEPVEGTEVYDMLQRFPHAACHDDTNYIFVAEHPSPVNPIRLSDVPGYFEMGSTEKVQAIAIMLFSTDRTRAIHLSRGDAIQLHAQPAWKLWCGKYEDKDLLEADHLAVFGVGVDRRKGLSTLTQEAKQTVRSVFSHSA